MHSLQESTSASKPAEGAAAGAALGEYQGLAATALQQTGDRASRAELHCRVPPETATYTGRDHVPPAQKVGSKPLAPKLPLLSSPPPPQRWPRSSRSAHGAASWPSRRAQRR